MASDSSAESAPDRSGSVGYHEWLVIYLKGFAMGTADAVPGVSGGTIALITGIYERLIRALTALDPSALRFLSGLHRQNTRSRFWQSLDEMDVPFLVVLGLGMVSAVVVLARLVQVALAALPAPTFAFFAGLIGASALILLDRRWLTQPTQIAAAIAGFVVAFVVDGASTSGVFPQTAPMVFVAGAIAICGMVLPGISGAFILLLLGQYEYLTAVLTRFTDGLAALVVGSGDTTMLLQDGTVVATFVVGAFVGLMTIAYVVRWALEHYRSATFAFLVSLMVGALRYPIEQIAEANPSGITVATVVLAVVFGAAAVLLLDRYTDDLEYVTEDETGVT